MTVEVSCYRLVIAVKDLIGVVGLISHGIDLAKRHVANCAKELVSRVLEKAQMKRLTDPSPLPVPFGVVQLVAHPGENAVRIPKWLVLIIEPDCRDTRERKGE